MISGATFPFLPFGLSSERETRRGVYVFLSVERCREYFTALDTLATKLTRIVPTESLPITETPYSRRVFTLQAIRRFIGTASRSSLRSVHLMASGGRDVKAHRTAIPPKQRSAA
jgi:hypothetical protein